MSESDNCVICNGKGKNLFDEKCPYCNGTGEPNHLAEEYMRNHICQCIFYDRKFCPICEKKCHHDSHQTPKQVIDSGHGGQSAIISYSNDSTSEPKEEELIIV